MGLATPRAAITALGRYVPERVLTNADLEKIVDTSDEWIRTRTGIRQRHVAEPGGGQRGHGLARGSERRRRRIHAAIIGRLTLRPAAGSNSCG